MEKTFESEMKELEKYLDLDIITCTTYEDEKKKIYEKYGKTYIKPKTFEDDRTEHFERYKKFIDKNFHIDKNDENGTVYVYNERQLDDIKRDLLKLIEMCDFAKDFGHNTWKYRNKNIDILYNIYLMNK